MLVKTKEEVVIDARTGEKKILYFDNPVFNWNEHEPNGINEETKEPEASGKVSYLVLVFEQLEQENTKYFNELPVGTSRIPLVYKMDNFIEMVKSVTFGKYKSTKGERLIKMIDENSHLFWGLKADNLEIVN